MSYRLVKAIVASLMIAWMLSLILFLTLCSSLPQEIRRQKTPGGGVHKVYLSELVCMDISFQLTHTRFCNRTSPPGSLHRKVKSENAWQKLLLQFSYQVFVQEILQIEIAPGNLQVEIVQAIFIPGNPTRKFAGKNLPGKSHQEISNLKAAPGNSPRKFSHENSNCKSSQGNSPRKSKTANAFWKNQNCNRNLKVQNCIVNLKVKNCIDETASQTALSKLH